MKQTAGTSLISELVGHEETVTIIPGDSYRENGVYVHDAFNGKGTDSRVYYDFDSNVPVVVHDRKTGKGVKENIPCHIALGHELIHAHKSLKGIAKEGNLLYSYVGEKDSVSVKIEELETVGIGKYNYRFTENDLREEENLNERLRY